MTEEITDKKVNLDIESMISVFLMDSEMKEPFSTTYLLLPDKHCHLARFYSIREVVHCERTMLTHTKHAMQMNC